MLNFLNFKSFSIGLPFSYYLELFILDRCRVSEIFFSSLQFKNLQCSFDSKFDIMKYFFTPSIEIYSNRIV